MKKSILVTGGNGLLASNLKNIMPDAKYVDIDSYNLCFQRDVERIFYHDHFHTVVHLAARVGGIKDNMEKPVQFLEDNILMNTNVLQTAYECGVQRFIGMASTCIFPDNSLNPDFKYPLVEENLIEGMPEKTNIYYAYAKRCMAMQINAYNEQYKTKYCYLIPGNMIGMGDHSKGNKMHFATALIYKIVQAQKEGKKEIRLFGTGKPLRQFVDAMDVAKVIKIMIDRDIMNNFNVVPNENLSINEIALKALKVCGAEDFNIIYETGPDGIYRKDASNEKLKKFIPDFKFTPLEESIKKVYEWIKNNG